MAYAQPPKRMSTVREARVTGAGVTEAEAEAEAEEKAGVEPQAGCGLQRADGREQQSAEAEAAVTQLPSGATQIIS